MYNGGSLYMVVVVAANELLVLTVGSVVVVVVVCHPSPLVLMARDEDTVLPGYPPEYVTV